MVPKVIRTEADYEAALARVDELMVADPGTRRGDELELLVTLIELYEEEKYPIGPPTALDAIRFRMEQAGLSASDLVPYIGSRSKVSEMLSGKRRLSLRMIRSLHEGLGIPAESLLQQDKPSSRTRAVGRHASARNRSTHQASRRMRRLRTDEALAAAR
jgi:HTH-type transcriptional regulator/antitoxin HigA